MQSDGRTDKRSHGRRNGDGRTSGLALGRAHEQSDGRIGGGTVQRASRVVDEAIGTEAPKEPTEAPKEPTDAHKEPTAAESKQAKQQAKASWKEVMHVLNIERAKDARARAIQEIQQEDERELKKQRVGEEEADVSDAD